MKRNIGNRPIQRAKVDGFLLIEIDDGRLLRIAIAIGGEQLADGPVRQIKLVTAEYVRQIQPPLFPRFFSPARRSHLRAEPAREPLDDIQSPCRAAYALQTLQGTPRKVMPPVDGS